MIYKVGVALCIIFTAYGQIAAKIATRQLGPLPPDWSGRLAYLGQVVIHPYIISCFVAATLAALSWIMALSGLEISRAYPFTSLNFVVMMILGAVLFGEAITTAKLVGVSLIIAGVIVGSVFN